MSHPADDTYATIEKLIEPYFSIKDRSTFLSVLWDIYTKGEELDKAEFTRLCQQMLARS